MTMFEVRVLCRQLPKSFNDFEDDTTVISFGNCRSMLTMNVEQEKRHHDRQCLAKTLEMYELQIEENEKFFQKEWLRLFESDDILNHEESVHQLENFKNCLSSYLEHRIDTGLRKIRYKETIFRRKLNHPRRRHSSQVSPSSLSRNTAMNVYPEAIVEISPSNDDYHRFTDKELALLSSPGMLSILIVLCECT